jgi:hypothetical protein
MRRRWSKAGRSIYVAPDSLLTMLRVVIFHWGCNPPSFAEWSQAF